MVLGHACGMPPTGAKITVLVVLKTELTVLKIYLAACCSWVGRWDDGGLGAVVLLRCCLLFVVAVVVFADVLFFLCLSIFVCACWCARSSYRHGTRSSVRYVAHRRQQ